MRILNSNEDNISGNITVYPTNRSKLPCHYCQSMRKFFFYINLSIALLLAIGARSQSCTARFDSAYRKKVFTNVDQAAEFPGGEAAKMRFLMQHLRYPDTDDLQTSVQVAFIVNEKGMISHLSIPGKQPSAYTALDREAMRVTILSQPWEPARCGKKMVPSYVILSVSCIKLEIETTERQAR